jgi:hypothetical protein
VIAGSLAISRLNQLYAAMHSLIYYYRKDKRAALGLYKQAALFLLLTYDLIYYLIYYYRKDKRAALELYKQAAERCRDDPEVVKSVA